MMHRSISTALSRTVQIDVGGIKYKIAQSLLEAHPETKLAKALQPQGGEAEGGEVFVDRNGSRFQYVLDYMRDGKVHLPVDVSKRSILEELEHFGFQGIDEDTIHGTMPTGQAVEHIVHVRKENTETICAKCTTRHLLPKWRMNVSKNI